MQPITRQSEYYGLDAPDRGPAPAPEKLAELLTPPTPWQGPMKEASSIEDEDAEDDQ